MNEISIGFTHRGAGSRDTGLASFEAALAAGTDAALRRVFWDQEVHWRDLMAFTWTITPHDSPDTRCRGRLGQHAAQHQGAAISVWPNIAPPPRRVMRHGVASIEAFFSFETETARCSGIVRLVADEPDKAWVLATQLDELKGHEEPIDLRRPAGSAYSPQFWR